MLHTCCSILNLLLRPNPSQTSTPSQPWRPRTPHTCCVLTRKRTPWRALVLVAALMWAWVWVQGELGVLSVVRLGSWSWVPLSWASWRRYSSLRWRLSWSESRDWSCNRSIEPRRIIESEETERERMREWHKRQNRLTDVKVEQRIDKATG